MTTSYFDVLERALRDVAEQLKPGMTSGGRLELNARECEAVVDELDRLRRALAIESQEEENESESSQPPPGLRKG